jgi:hypothetical protein
VLILIVGAWLARNASRKKRIGRRRQFIRSYLHALQF